MMSFREYKCDELCWRNKECITEREDGLCDQPDRYREVGDIIDAIMERHQEKAFR